MKNLKIYFIDDEPYIGVVYIYNNFNYFAPLSSPKPKHINMKLNAIDIFKVENGKLGIVNINNMIPCPEFVLTEALPNVKDIKYKKLLEKQISYINSKKEILVKKILNFQNRFRSGNLDNNILSRCCNFILLEEKCNSYKK